MPVTINGSTGISSPGGDTSTSLSTGLLTVTGSTVPANGMYLPAANTLAWTTNSTRNMTLDGSGRLCVINTSPLINENLSVQGNTNGAYTAVFNNNGAANFAGIALFNPLTNAGIGLTGNALAFYNADRTTERARIDSSGNLLVGATATVSNARFYVTANGNNAAARFYGPGLTDTNFVALFDKPSATTTTSQVFVAFTINAQATGSGQINANGANAAAFGSFSDARLKENIAALPDQLANILALKPSEFDYKDGSGHQIGFIAQEMQEVYPDAVGEGENGMLTITGWSKTEARLVKALQELTQRLEALEAK